MRDPGALFTWLYKVARSFCIKKRRKGKFAPRSEMSLEQEAGSETGQIADPAKNPEEAYSETELGRALERAIAALEPEYREVLLLRDVEGLTAPEVSEVVEVSVAAVKSRLHRARAAVREQMAPFLDVAEPAPEAVAEARLRKL